MSRNTLDTAPHPVTDVPFADALARLAAHRPDLIQVKDVDDCRLYYLPRSGSHTMSLVAEACRTDDALRFHGEQAGEDQLQGHLQRLLPAQGYGFELFSQQDGTVLATVGRYYLPQMIEPAGSAAAQQPAHALALAFVLALDGAGQ